jgi:hypothetical protein
MRALNLVNTNGQSFQSVCSPNNAASPKTSLNTPLDPYISKKKLVKTESDQSPNGSDPKLYRSIENYLVPSKDEPNYRQLKNQNFPPFPLHQPTILYSSHGNQNINPFPPQLTMMRHNVVPKKLHENNGISQGFLSSTNHITINCSPVNCFDGKHKLVILGPKAQTIQLYSPPHRKL